MTENTPREKNTKGLPHAEAITLFIVILVLIGVFAYHMSPNVDKANRAGAVTAARLVYTSAQTSLSERYAEDSASIHKNAAHIYTDVSDREVSRISSEVFCNYQHRRIIRPTGSEANKAKNLNTAVAGDILNSIQDEKNSTADWSFDNKDISGCTPSEYYRDIPENDNTPMIAVYYNSDGKVVCVEYADRSMYKVTVRNGSVDTEKDGRFFSIQTE